MSTDLIIGILIGAAICQGIVLLGYYRDWFTMNGFTGDLAHLVVMTFLVSTPILIVLAIYTAYTKAKRSQNKPYPKG